MKPLVAARRRAATDPSHSWPDRRSGASDELSLFLATLSAGGFAFKRAAVDRGARVRYMRIRACRLVSGQCRAYRRSRAPHIALPVYPPASCRSSRPCRCSRNSQRAYPQAGNGATSQSSTGSAASCDSQATAWSDLRAVRERTSLAGSPARPSRQIPTAVNCARR